MLLLHAFLRTWLDIWLVNEGLSTTAITYRLRALDAPTKCRKIWSKRAVHAILTNEAYTGKTFAFTAKDGKLYSKPKSEWIEIPGVTPTIISQELYNVAQKQLKLNQDKCIRNCKHEYLLRGHVRCRQCGQAFVGSSGQRYTCMGKLRMSAPVERCHNKSWMVDKLESTVWSELEHYLSNRNLITNALEKQRQEAGQLSVFEDELKRVERHLKAVNREQHQLLQWALKDFPADQVEAENRRLNKAKETLKAQKTQLERQLTVSQDAVISVPNLERFIEDIQKQLPNLDYEGKRLALDMLDITVYLDGESLEITGVISPEDSAIAFTSSR
ncbi:recombinase family protein [Chloroflexota bacterium]